MLRFYKHFFLFFCFSRVAAQSGACARLFQAVIVSSIGSKFSFEDGFESEYSSINKSQVA